MGAAFTCGLKSSAISILNSALGLLRDFVIFCRFDPARFDRIARDMALKGVVRQKAAP